MSDLSPSVQPAAGIGATPKRSRRRSFAGIVLIAVFVAGLVAFVMFLRGTEASGAAVGDCVKQEGDDALAIVACDGPDAEYEVLGRVEDQSEIEAGITSCAPFEDQRSTQAYWEGERGGTGFVLCLAEA